MSIRKASAGDPVRICFVCLGNICRSPIAEAVMRDLVRSAGLSAAIEVDSAGTSGLHIGERPDPRALEVLARHGVPSAHRGRQLGRGDFDTFDLFVVMDLDNRTDLLRLTRSGDEAAKVRLLRDFDPAADGEVEIGDPYYGTPEDFERVFAEITSSCKGLLGHLLDQYLGDHG